MRCIACNAELTDFEATRKTPTGGYLDLCDHCLDLGDRSDFELIEREDLRQKQTIEEVVEEYDY
jgi:hypothetical protein